MLQLNHTTKCSTDVINVAKPLLTNRVVHVGMPVHCEGRSSCGSVSDSVMHWLRIHPTETRLLTVSIGRVVVVNTP